MTKPVSRPVREWTQLRQGKPQLCRITFKRRKNTYRVPGTPSIAFFTSNELRFAACGVGEGEKCKESLVILGLVVHVSSGVHVRAAPRMMQG